MEPYELTDRDAELLSAYIDDALDADTRTSLEARLEQDADLRQELRSLQQTVALVRSLPDVRAPRNFTLTPEMVGLNDPAPMSQEKPILKVVPRRRSVWEIALASAAAFVLVFAGALVVMRVMNDEAPPTDNAMQVAAAPSMTAKMSTERAESTVAIDSDGSIVLAATEAATGGIAESQIVESTPVITIVDGVAIVTPRVNLLTLPQSTPTPAPTQSSVPGSESSQIGLVPPATQEMLGESGGAAGDGDTNDVTQQTFAAEAPESAQADEAVGADDQASVATSTTETSLREAGTGSSSSEDAPSANDADAAEEEYSAPEDAFDTELEPMPLENGFSTTEASGYTVELGSVLRLLMVDLYQSSAETPLFKLPGDQVITLRDAFDVFLHILAGVAGGAQSDR